MACGAHSARQLQRGGEEPGASAGVFLLARPLTEAEAAEVFAETLVDFEDAALIERDAAGSARWTASVDLRPHAADDGTEIFVAADLGAHQRPGVLRKDHVLGIGHASLTLAQITERTPSSVLWIWVPAAVFRPSTCSPTPST